MRSACGQSPSWTSCSAWTRWRNLSGPQPPCYPVWRRFPWTKHQHCTTDGKRCLLTTQSVSTRPAEAPTCQRCSWKSHSKRSYLSLSLFMQAGVVLSMLIFRANQLHVYSYNTFRNLMSPTGHWPAPLEQFRVTEKAFVRHVVNLSEVTASNTTNYTTVRFHILSHHWLTHDHHQRGLSTIHDSWVIQSLDCRSV